MGLWTYTLAPFPQRSDVEYSPIQLRPFPFVDDILGFDTSGISALMSNPAVLQATLNIVLFAPLGWFLRQLAGRGIVMATITGFAISSFIEFIQLSGIWGLYGSAYRVFVTTLRGDGEIAEPGDSVVNIAFLLPPFAQLITVLSGGVALGERLVLICAAQTRLPAAISRPLRFLFGIGGYMLLSQWPFPGSGLILTGLVLATFIMVFTTCSHRGLACAVAGIEIVDARAARRDDRAPRR